MKWRNQKFRPDTGKWANFGGQNKDWYGPFWLGIRKGTAMEGMSKGEQDTVLRQKVNAKGCKQQYVRQGLRRRLCKRHRWHRARAPRPVFALRL